MKSCSPKIFKFTRYFHVLAIIVIVIGTGINMYASLNHQYTGFWLPLALSIMCIFRLPNQICVSHEHKDGWLSVIGSVIALIAYIATVIIIIYTHHTKAQPKGDSVEEESRPTLLGL